MRALAILLALLAMLSAALPAAAQSIVTSREPQSTSVTLYRAPGRDEGPMDAKWPGGYALITETRTVQLPAGHFVLRFEGVAEGMMPETAIVTGLPKQIGEKNRDARLLSPAALVNAFLKRRVTVRRTNPATGKVTTQEAVIQAGPSAGVVLTTAEGVEALGCSGLPEGLVYPDVPADLASKPTLSVTGDNAAPATVTVQLSYLSQGFDWSADYVAEVSEDGTTLDLFAWMTVANGGSQGFAGARTQAVAGAPHKEANARLPPPPPPELHLQCWPMDITSTHPSWGGPVPPPPPPPPAPMEAKGMMDIVVTASRRDGYAVTAVPIAALTAQQEDLGDLKLYRIPEPVTVAAQSRKQVAMLDRKQVRFDRIYTGTFDQREWRRDQEQSEPEQASVVLRTENRDAKGLGLPLPAGRVTVYEDGREGPLLVSESPLSDRAIGDEVELQAGESNDLRYRITPLPPSDDRAPYRVEVTNARSTPETFELPIPFRLDYARAKLIERKGVKTWRVTVPANGSATLEFGLKLRERG